MTVVWIIAGLTAVSVSDGLANSLLFSTRQVGAGNTTVPKCATAGVTVFENVSGVTIATVTVSNINPACGGGTLSLTVNNGTTTGSGSAIVPSGGGSMTVTLGSAVPVIDSTTVDLVVLGP